MNSEQLKGASSETKKVNNCVTLENDSSNFSEKNSIFRPKAGSRTVYEFNHGRWCSVMTTNAGACS